MRYELRRAWQIYIDELDLMKQFHMSKCEKDKFLRKAKERIRRLNKNLDAYPNKNWRLPYGSNGDIDDGRMCKYILPVVLSTEEKEEYIEEIWEHCPNSQYDCTGYWFTTRIYVFPIPQEDKTIVYHFQCCDI